MSTRPDRPGRPGCPDDGTDDAAEQARRRAARRARLDRIFGDVLPETNGDETARNRSREGGGGTDEWLRSNVPPHHG